MLEMNPNQVHHYLQTTHNTPCLLDVRERWELDICCLEGITHIPMGNIAAQLHTLDSEQDIIVICHHGIRSRMVGQFLEQKNFSNIINLSGGMTAWTQNVDTSMTTY